MYLNAYQVILQHAQNNRSSIAIHLGYMSSNPALAACIGVHYICIADVLLLPVPFLACKIICKCGRRHQIMLHFLFFYLF